MDKEWKYLETIPAWQLDNVESNKEDILDRKCGVITQFQKYKGRIVLRGDIAKDDSGACAVFTEQGSSASQMTAAKVIDVIARLPDCD